MRSSSRSSRRTHTGRQSAGGRRGGRVDGSRRGGTQDSGFLLSLCFALMPRCYSRRGRWPVIEGRRRADSSLLLESEGSAQLGTAGLLSVCLSPSKSTPLTPTLPYLFPPLPHLSLPSDRCPRLTTGCIYQNELR